MTMVSFSKVAAFVIPVMAASGGLYWIQRHTWPLGRTIKHEWYDATHEMALAMPRQGSPTPVRLNPFSEKLNFDAGV